jgi:hypothetical protein
LTGWLVSSRDFNKIGFICKEKEVITFPFSFETPLFFYFYNKKCGHTTATPRYGKAALPYSLKACSLNIHRAGLEISRVDKPSPQWYPHI